MYTVIDLWSGKQCQHESRNEIAARIFPLKDFSFLCMNPNDVLVCHYSCTQFDPQEENLVTVKDKTVYRRRWMVQDENGRVVDPRQWEDSCWEPVRKKAVGCSWAHSGGKVHKPSCHGPSCRGSVRRAEDPDIEADVILDRSRVRSKLKKDPEGGRCYNFSENKIYKKWNRPRSWKDQCKSHFQWSKRYRRPRFNTRAPNAEIEGSNEFDNEEESA